MEPNREQKAILKGGRSARRMVVKALAGTGKTSTLELLTRDNPHVSYLYVAYNRAIKDDAAARFPQNVRCQTSHGMVFMQYGKRYSRKLNAPRVPSRKAAQILGLKELRAEYCVSCQRAVVPGDGAAHQGHAVMAETLDSAPFASLVTRTVDRWCHSADREIGEQHVPWLKGVDERLMPGLRAQVVPHARQAWEDLKSADGKLKFSHDMYLKMAQLDGWRAQQSAVLLDEAQDTNPCVADLLLGQKGKRFVLVGDSNQAIYEWRGAQDAMEGFPADVSLGLTGSYRFGPAVAEEANKWLRALGSDMELRGWKRKAEVTGRDTVVKDELERYDALLTRSNGGAIASAIAALDSGRKVAIVGGGGEIERLARAAQDLQEGKRAEHPDLVAFESWSDVQRYCKEEPEDAGTLVPLVRAIDAHGAQSIRAMTSRLVAEDAADLVISTAHKAKGRQWRRVQIGNDFPQPKEGKTMGKEELRLAYVAVTRAQDELGRGSLDWIDGGAPAPQEEE